MEPADVMRRLSRLYAFARAGDVHHSRPVEGNAGTMGIGEKLWWAYKYYGNSVRRAEKGTGIEEYFAAQDLQFTLPEGFEEESRAVITAGGDLLSSDEIRPETTGELWAHVRDFLFEADLAVANLETPVAPSRPVAAPPKSILAAPPLNTSVAMLRTFTADGAGFTFFSTANNHSLDQGVDGLVETLDVLDEQGCGHVGTSRTPAEREDIPVLDLNGIRVALLSYTFSVNGRDPGPGQEYVVNYVRLNAAECDLSMIQRHVHIAREVKRADLVVACLHWSLEFESYPMQRLIDRAHDIVELGIDVIVGNHPHVVQPAERYEFEDPFTGQRKQALIAYALGDLTSYHPTVPDSMLAMLLRVTVAGGREAGAPIARVAHVDVLPVHHELRFAAGRCVDYRLRPLADAARNAVGTNSVHDVRRLVELAGNLFPAVPTAGDLLERSRS